MSPLKHSVCQRQVQELRSIVPAFQLVFVGGVERVENNTLAQNKSTISAKFLIRPTIRDTLFLASGSLLQGWQCLAPLFEINLFEKYSTRS